MKRLDLTLYGVLDPAQCGERPIADLAAAAVGGGATAIQLRDKSGSARSTIEAVAALKGALTGRDVPIIVNDRVDVAHASGADGVHVGQDDLPPAAARAILGPKAIVGVTVRTDDEARATDLEPADYVGLGGVFATDSKINETVPIGTKGVARIGAILRSRKPGIGILAIAGINKANAASVISAGADGVAVLSALFGADDPVAAAKDLRGVIDPYLGEAAG